MIKKKKKKKKKCLPTLPNNFQTETLNTYFFIWPWKLCFKITELRQNQRPYDFCVLCAGKWGVADYIHTLKIGRCLICHYEIKFTAALAKFCSNVQMLQEIISEVC